MVTALYYQALAPLGRLDPRASHEVMAGSLAIAVRLGDGPVRAYTRYGLIDMDTLEAIDREMIEDILHFGDNYARNWSHWIIAMDYMFRGPLKGGARRRRGSPRREKSTTTQGRSVSGKLDARDDKHLLRGSRGSGRKRRRMLARGGDAL